MNPVSKRWDKVARKYEEFFWSQPLLLADADAIERLVQAAEGVIKKSEWEIYCADAPNTCEALGELNAALEAFREIAKEEE